MGPYSFIHIQNVVNLIYKNWCYFCLKDEDKFKEEEIAEGFADVDKEDLRKIRSSAARL